ncbi:MAG: hypothetical protein HC803_01080 [Saprospiraceae bacterium]|nr:hypothetical protein [Saprospiraceae bacterium]
MEIKTNNLEQSVEQIGVVFEAFGRTPMEGRVFALLLLSEPPHRSFDDIREFLKASKSAISIALNKLMNEGTVTYITFSGDRKRYFQLNLDNWLNRLRDGAKDLTALNNVTKQALELRVNSKYLIFNEGLEKIIEFQEFLEIRIKEAIKEWKKHH